MDVSILANLAEELQYVLLIFGMFVVSKYLQCFKIPAAITCVGLGVAFGLGFETFQDEPTIKLLAVLGIVAMFLFAGMEIDFAELKKERSILLQHIVIQVVSVLAATFVLTKTMNLDARAAMLVAFALFTPSTGFILDALPTLPVTEAEAFWIKTKAISTEIVALAGLFFLLQSSTGIHLAYSSLAMLGMIILLPALFLLFAAKILPHAPKTEFAFLVIAALLCASITKKLGVYYLVGAFVVGIVQQRMRTKIPAIAPPHLLHAVELFAGFFIPFYFLKAGLSLRAENFTIKALVLGLSFAAIALPLRILMVALHRRISLGEPLKKGARMGIALLPTLVFALVLSDILREKFHASPDMMGALIVYAILSTVLPSLIIRENC